MVQFNFKNEFLSFLFFEANLSNTVGIHIEDQLILETFNIFMPFHFDMNEILSFFEILYFQIHVSFSLWFFLTNQSVFSIFILLNNLHTGKTISICFLHSVFVWLRGISAPMFQIEKSYILLGNTQSILSSYSDFHFEYVGIILSRSEIESLVAEYIIVIIIAINELLKVVCEFIKRHPERTIIFIHKLTDFLCLRSPFF